MSGTTCDIPVPPALCAVVGGAAIEFSRCADGVGVKAAAIFVPRALIPRVLTAHISHELLNYRRVVIQFARQCLKHPATEETDYFVLARCIGAKLLDHFQASPAALFVNKDDEIGWDFRDGGIIDLLLPSLGVEVYVLPHHVLGHQ